MFIGPFEHHSNILPWRESYADVVQIAENDAGNVDLQDLESKLKQYSSRNLKIGTKKVLNRRFCRPQKRATVTRSSNISRYKTRTNLEWLSRT